MNQPVPSLFPLWLRAIRLHQWVKNALLLVPFTLAGGLLSAADWQRGLIAVLVFGLAASAIYLLNDVIDLPHDRQHATKRHRPLAAGRIRPSTALGVAAVLMAGAGAGAWQLGGAFMASLGLYVGATLVFCFMAKRVAVLDVLVLAGLYTIRIFAGMTLIEQPISYWLLTFSLFFFLSLAFAKRYVELYELAPSGATKVPGRAYRVGDMPYVLAGGMASAFAGAMLFAIYLANEQFRANVFHHPQWLWAIALVLLYWLLRLWFLATRGQLNQDPILFAITDRVSIGMGAMTLLLVGLAW